MLYLKGLPENSFGSFIQDLQQLNMWASQLRSWILEEVSIKKREIALKQNSSLHVIDALGLQVTTYAHRKACNWPGILRSPILPFH